MRGMVLSLALFGAASLPGAVRAQVAEANFQVRNTGDLVALCASTAGDRLYTAAQNFCQGFLVGAYQTLQAQQAASRSPLFCPPAQMPTRNQAVADFVQWTQASPDRMQMPPVDGVASFLVERAPCPPQAGTRSAGRRTTRQ